MTTQQLEYFIELCKYKNFTTAAEKLFMSQQGLSMAINRLEAEFDTRFFVRTRQGLVLTKQGEFFLVHANNLLNLHHQCENHFAVASNEEANLDVAVAQEADAAYVAEAAEAFRKENPEFRINLFEKNDSQCDNAVESLGFKIGFGIEPLDDTKFEHCRLFSSDIVLAVHRSHPLANARSLSLRQFDGLILALPDTSMKMSSLFMKLTEAAGVKPNILCRVSELFDILRIVNQNICAGLTVRTVAEYLAYKDVVLIPLDIPGLRWDVSIFRKKDSELNKKEQQFFDYFRQKEI